MNSLRPTTSPRRGAMKATRSSLRVATKQVLISTSRSNVMIRWVVALLMMVISLPMFAQYSTKNYLVTLKSVDNKTYAILTSKKDEASGDLHVPSQITIENGGKKETYPVYAVRIIGNKLANVIISKGIKEAVLNSSSVAILRKPLSTTILKV